MQNMKVIARCSATAPPMATFSSAPLKTIRVFPSRKRCSVHARQLVGGVMAYYREQTRAATDTSMHIVFRRSVEHKQEAHITIRLH